MKALAAKFALGVHTVVSSFVVAMLVWQQAVCAFEHFLPPPSPPFTEATYLDPEPTILRPQPMREFQKIVGL